MKEIYFNNAATSYPKPKCVADAVLECINKGNVSPINYADNMISEARKKISTFFGSKNNNVVFTKSVTESANLVLNGLFKEGDHIISTQMDHNAVIRPLQNLKKTRGIEFSLASCDSDGYICLFTLEKLIKDNTKAIVLTHASNVCGTILPIREIGEICKKHGILLIVDTAQTAGLIPINMEEDGIDILMFTGHKWLMGLEGVGGIVFNGDIYKEINPLIYGGTGLSPELDTMPEELPQKFEGGTRNTTGICSLSASIDYINSIGQDELLKAGRKLKKLFIDNLKGVKGIEIIGYNEFVASVPIVSLKLEKTKSKDLAEFLEARYNIISKPGLQCSPSSHKALGTFPNGTIRFSFNHFNTEEEVLFTCDKIKEFMANQD